MTIKWKITSVNPEQGSVEVVWINTDGTEFGPYNCALPLVNEAYPSGAELKKIIDGYTPLGELERMAAVKAVKAKDTKTKKAMGHIEARIGVEEVADLNVFTVQAEVVQVPKVKGTVHQVDVR